MSGRHFPAININRIAQCLEGIKADPHRQDEIERMGLHFPTEKSKGLYEVLNKEIRVLEIGKEAEVAQEACPKEQFAFCLSTGFPQGLADSKIYAGAEGNQKEKLPIPPPIKEVADDEEHRILPLQISSKPKPVQQKDNGQEDCKVN